MKASAPLPRVDARLGDVIISRGNWSLNLEQLSAFLQSII